MNPIQRVIGVDFSGAKLAGQNIWVAQVAIDGDRLNLEALDSLETLCGTSERAGALAWLVEFIREQQDTLVAIDFPFGLPVELGWRTWPEQLGAVATWAEGANEFGRECVRRARLLGDKMHIRRQTDQETKTPFDCYHYRIIYQTFHGMRDVMLPLAKEPRVAVAPFSPATKLTEVVVVEACPGSSLKRWKLPHNNYKQPTGGELTDKRVATRQTLMRFLKSRVELTRSQQSKMMLNPGGDAFDSVIAAVGSLEAFLNSDLSHDVNHARYPYEGKVYS